MSLMIKILFTLLLSPLMLTAQDPKPSYTNDTLYATCGYKFYKGQKLHFSKGTGKKGQFRYVTILNGITASSLNNNSIVIRELKNVKILPLDVGYVDVIGTIIFKDSTKATIELQIAYDKAIENDPDLFSELTVPSEFRNSKRVILHQQLNKLFKLYASGSISKTAYEIQKKKLLEN
jgi:hypothetical protein